MGRQIKIMGGVFLFVFTLFDNTLHAGGLPVISANGFKCKSVMDNVTCDGKFPDFPTEGQSFSAGGLKYAILAIHIKNEEELKQFGYDSRSGCVLITTTSLRGGNVFHALERGYERDIWYDKIVAYTPRGKKLTIPLTSNYKNKLNKHCPYSAFWTYYK